MRSRLRRGFGGQARRHNKQDKGRLAGRCRLGVRRLDCALTRLSLFEGKSGLFVRFSLKGLHYSPFWGAHPRKIAHHPSKKAFCTRIAKDGLIILSIPVHRGFYSPLAEKWGRHPCLLVVSRASWPAISAHRADATTLHIVATSPSRGLNRESIRSIPKQPEFREKGRSKIRGAEGKVGISAEYIHKGLIFGSFFVSMFVKGDVVKHPTLFMKEMFSY